MLGQARDHELMALYAQALRELGRFLGDARRRSTSSPSAGGSAAAARARRSPAAWRLYADRGFYKRAQIVPANLALAGVAEFDDLDRLTIFADNLVPHVLRCDGVLVYADGLAALIDAGRPLRSGGPQEREIRACAVHACELLSERLGLPAAGDRPPAVDPRPGSRATRRARGTAAAASTTEAAQPPAGLRPRTGRSGRTFAGCSPSPASSASRRSSSASRADSSRIASATGSGRWIQSASGPSGRTPSTLHDVAGVADDRAVRRDVGDDDAVGADLRAVADADRAEQLGAAADRHVVLDRRVALAGREAGAAERDALVERHVVADLGRLADHDAGAVVDEEALADAAPPGGSRSRSARG